MQKINPNKLARQLATSSPLALGIYEFGYSAPKHLRFIQNIITDAIKTGGKRIILTVPPRHGKSELVSFLFPAWLLLRYPCKKIILASYESSFAASFGRKARDLYLRYSNDLAVETRSHWENSKGGYMKTAGLEAGITGKGANIFIVDDPVKNISEARSAVMRNKTFDNYKSAVYSRLEPDKFGIKPTIIIIQTRWHADDLAGRLIQTGNYELINLPAFAQQDDALGRELNEPLWAERFNAETLSVIKTELGETLFSALYQQSPTTSETEKIKKEYWNKIDLHDLDLSDGQIYLSWDTAYKTGEMNDYSVCSVWLTKNEKHYLIDLFRGKLEFPYLKQKFIELAKKYPSDSILIEDKASGQSLIQELKLIASDNNFIVKPIQVENDKNIRVEMSLSEFAKGNVYIANETWQDAVITECSEFPLAQHDDIVDSITQYLNYIKKLTRKSFFAW